jgi:hypothetical protein
LRILLYFFLGFAPVCRGEIPGTGELAATVLYEEGFDRLTPPALPAGWKSSSSRIPGTNDFVTTSSSPLSPTNAAQATNATVEQWIVSCPLVRAAIFPAVLSFAIRRSATFSARCVIEASTDGGRTFPVVVGESPAAFPASEYQTITMDLPANLAAADTFHLRWHIIAGSSGTTATLRLDNVQLLRPRPAVARGTVVINEILSQPATGQSEWIELLNTGNEPVDVSGWGIRDTPTGSVHTIAAGITLPGTGAFLVVAADSSAVRVVAGPAVAVVQPEGFPSLNNSGDMVLLQDEHGTTIDSLRYEPAWGGEAGISLERIDPSGPSTAAGNWGSSRATTGSTPGGVNSIVIRPLDLGAFRTTWSYVPAERTVVFEVTVRNAGSQPSSACIVELSVQADGASLPEPIASGRSDRILAKGESTVVECRWSTPRPGRSMVTAAVLWPDDQRPDNNTSSCLVDVPVPSGSLRINEIQAAPLSSTAEFVEIINASELPVSVEGCFLADRHPWLPQVRRWPLTDVPLVLAPQGLHVTAGDSSVLSLAALSGGWCTVVGRSGLGLNNDADTLLLCGADSVLIDSVVYHASWHSATVPDPSGRSLERYHPLLAGSEPGNWGTCVDPSGATPGRSNSILLRAPVSGAALACTPDPFSPDADGHDDATLVRYHLPMRSALVRIRIFDIRGRCIRELVNAAPAGMTGDVVWDGMGEGRVPLRMGIYILYLEAIDEAGGRMHTAKCAVVLARRL